MCATCLFVVGVAALALCACGGKSITEERGTVYGEVTLRTGDCMPVVLPGACKVEPVARRVVAYDPQKMVCGEHGCDYPNPASQPERGSTRSSAGTGKYELSLPIGKYSLFLEEPAGAFYATGMSSDCDCVEPAELHIGDRIERDLQINYASD